LTSNANTSLGTVELVVRVQDTNAKITIINKVGPHRQKLVQALTQIINIIPDDIQVTGITLDALSNAAQISGQGADQATILSLKQALEEVDNISEVKLPLSVFEKQQNIIFTVSFQWLPETNT
jgi:hypothetical protein